jgi:hypothetical protein
VDITEEKLKNAPKIEQGEIRRDRSINRRRAHRLIASFPANP